MKMEPMKTQTIAGHTIKLVAGRRYRASRNMAQVGVTEYTIKIEGESGEFVMFLPPVDYELANEFLAEFNNGRSSFDGRIW